MSAEHVAPVGAATGAPKRAGLVLAALILGAAVANLNLAVANVALPSIGKAFDSSQTSLNMIAVGYSLGLAASVLYLGAVGDRYGRKLMLMLGITLSIPACLLAAYAPNDTVLIIARIFGGVSAGMAYPTTLALIAALWSGPGRTKTIALWSALGGAISSLGPLMSGLPARALLVGVGLPGHPAAGGRRTGDGRALRARPRQRGLRAGRQPRRRPVGADDRCAGDRHQLRRRTGLEDAADRHGRHRAGRRRCLRAAAAAGPQPALRPRRRRAPDLLGRRARRHHRLRLADGRDVHRPAVPAERARLLDPRGRDVDHPGRGDDGADRAALRQARRVPRRALHVARRLRVRVPRLPHDAAALEGGQRLLAGRASPTPWSAPASGSPAPRRRTRSPERCRSAGSAWHREPPTCSATSAAR